MNFVKLKGRKGVYLRRVGSFLPVPRLDSSCLPYNSLLNQSFYLLFIYSVSSGTKSEMRRVEAKREDSGKGFEPDFDSFHLFTFLSSDDSPFRRC